MGNLDLPKLVLSTQKKEGLFKNITTFLVIYDDKTIISYLSEEKQNEENKKITSKFKREGKGLLKSSAEMMRFWAHYHERFLTMTPEEVVLEDPENFCIKNQDIEKFTFTPKYDEVFTEDGSNVGKIGKIKIAADGTKYEFSHQYQKNQKIIYDLTAIFGPVLKIK